MPAQPPAFPQTTCARLHPKHTRAPETVDDWAAVLSCQQETAAEAEEVQAERRAAMAAAMGTAGGNLLPPHPPAWMALHPAFMGGHHQHPGLFPGMLPPGMDMQVRAWVGFGWV